MMKILAFAGLAKAGKTTAANAAGQALFAAGYQPVMERFAGPLKDASEILGFSKGGIHDDYYRQFTQLVGTDLVRNKFEEPDWWVKLMADRLDAIAADEQADFIECTGDGHDESKWHERVVLIDDVRFMNEVGLIRKYSGTSVFISSMRRLEDIAAAWRDHPSERLAHDYEMMRGEDTLFDSSISNNVKGEQPQFRKLVGKLAVSLVENQT